MSIAKKSQVLKVILLGDGGAGKTSLMHQYVNSEFMADTRHTLGVEFMEKEVDIGDSSFHLQIWDTAGQERFRSLRTPFYRGCDICLLVFSVVKLESFQNLSYWKQEFLQYSGLSEETAQTSTFPFVVLANKIDLPERTVTPEEITCFCSANEISLFFETSAKTAENVDAAFREGVRKWEEFERSRNPRGFARSSSRVDLNQSSSGASRCCRS